MANPAPENPRETALQSYSGRRLSGSEFEDVYAITGIIARDIERTGSFFEVRKGYAFAYSSRPLGSDHFGAFGIVGWLWPAR
jgi:hypothetical protein